MRRDNGCLQKCLLPCLHVRFIRFETAYGKIEIADESAVLEAMSQVCYSCA